MEVSAFKYRPLEIAIYESAISYIAILKNTLIKNNIFKCYLCCEHAFEVVTRIVTTHGLTYDLNVFQQRFGILSKLDNVARPLAAILHWSNSPFRASFRVDLRPSAQRDQWIRTVTQLPNAYL